MSLLNLNCLPAAAWMVLSVVVQMIVPSPVVAAEPLAWAPPAQTDPQTVNVVKGKTFYGPFPETADMILLFPKQVVTHQINVVGGRHIRIIGGSLRPQQGIRSVLRLSEVSGSAFLEGLEIDAAQLSGDGINVSGKRGFAPDVYLQNIRVLNIHGSAAGEHADIFQAQAAIGNLRVDRLTGTSNYQGFFLRREFPIASVTLKQVNLSFFANPDHPVTYLLWLRQDEDYLNPYPVRLEAVYIEPRGGQSVGANAVMPSTTAPYTPAAEVDGQTTWPRESRIEGAVTSGLPPGGDFVPAGKAGLGYVPPGYRK